MKDAETTWIWILGAKIKETEGDFPAVEMELSIAIYGIFLEGKTKSLIRLV